MTEPSPEALAWAASLMERLRDHPETRGELTDHAALRLAKILRKSHGVPLFAARSMIATVMGFATWKDAYTFILTNDETDRLKLKWQRSHVATIRKKSRARRRFATQLAAATEAHDKAGTTAIPEGAVKTATGALRPGSQPVDRVAVRVFSNRDPREDWD